MAATFGEKTRSIIFLQGIWFTILALVLTFGGFMFF
jgi:hypothetical protein